MIRHPVKEDRRTMARFDFRLQPLVKLREAERDRCRQELAQAYQAELILAERRQMLCRDMEEAKNLSRSKSRPGAIEVNGLLDAHRYELVLKTQLHHLDLQREKLEVEVERRRQALIAADQELRILEKLRERRKEEFRREQEKLDIRQLDEIASRCPRDERGGGRP